MYHKVFNYINIYVWLIMMFVYTLLIMSWLFVVRLSVSNDLRVDAERDLRDIGAGKIEVYPLNKVCC